MKIDGDLRKIFPRHLPHFHWQSVETWSTGQGVPDANFCSVGIEGWIEFKSTNAWAVTVRPGQVAWIERRARAGGRVFLAVRRQSMARGAKIDELWLLDHRAARELAMPKSRLSYNGNYRVFGVFEKNPASWNWDEIEKILLQPTNQSER